MAPTPHRRRPRERGTSLLEAMIALTVLLVGMLGMAKLQVFGMSTTQGARAQTIATELAVELASGISRLPSSDARLTGSSKGAPDFAPPDVFGPLLPHGVPTSGVHAYDDSQPIPYTRLDASLERDPGSPSRPVYQRRWTVWDAATTTNAQAKVIAVSVIWRERGLARPREIVTYVHSELAGSFMADLNAFR